MSGGDVLYLVVEFEGQDFPLVFPVELNGRRVERVTTGGVDVPLPDAEGAMSFEEGEGHGDAEGDA